MSDMPTTITEAEKAGWDSLDARCEKCQVVSVYALAPAAHAVEKRRAGLYRVGVCRPSGTRDSATVPPLEKSGWQSGHFEAFCDVSRIRWVLEGFYFHNRGDAQRRP
jgi:hypothetical protein